MTLHIKNQDGTTSPVPTGGSPQLQKIEPLITREDARAIANNARSPHFTKIEDLSPPVHEWVIDAIIASASPARAVLSMTEAEYAELIDLIGDDRIGYRAAYIIKRACDTIDGLAVDLGRWLEHLDSVTKDKPAGALQVWSCVWCGHLSPASDIDGRTRHTFGCQMSPVAQMHKALLGMIEKSESIEDLRAAMSAEVESRTIIEKILSTPLKD